MVGMIDGFRWCILGGDSPIYWPGFLISLVVIAGMLVLGARSFRRSERAFADMV
jgi:lipopolysaccharide transport system permease protein